MKKLKKTRLHMEREQILVLTELDGVVGGMTGITSRVCTNGIPETGCVSYCGGSAC